MTSRLDQPVGKETGAEKSASKRWIRAFQAVSDVETPQSVVGEADGFVESAVSRAGTA